mmetsp:Transcript_5825/g.11894  ORF Transcript_5825/g.11894 Transcript_5825/m.11894 type:complete len:162 (+) Transcript_5825:825-1310(+)
MAETPQTLSFYDDSAIPVSAWNVTAVPHHTGSTNQQAQTTASRDGQIVVGTPLPPGQSNLPVARAYRQQGAAFQKRALPPRVQAFKERRRTQQATAAVTGGIVGGIFLGPLGAVLVGFMAHGTTKSIGRRRQARLEKRIAAEENAPFESRIEEDTSTAIFT